MFTIPSPLPWSIVVPGSGRWVLTHRATPRAWTEKGTTGKTPLQRRKPPESASVEENNKDNVLDEPFLVSADFLRYCLNFLIALCAAGEILLVDELCSCLSLPISVPPSPPFPQSKAPGAPLTWV